MNISGPQAACKSTFGRTARVGFTGQVNGQEGHQGTLGHLDRIVCGWARAFQVVLPDLPVDLWQMDAILSEVPDSSRRVRARRTPGSVRRSLGATGSGGVNQKRSVNFKKYRA